MNKTACLLALFTLSFFVSHAQLKDCKDCSISSFQSVTMYYIVQPGSSFGFGLEAGQWNKEGSRFSYFLGSKMQWFRTDPGSDKFNNNANNLRFSFYLKGQAKIVNKLYLVVTPQFVNLSTFETGLGLRYTYPLSEVIGIGVEPIYSIINKEYSLNANIHLAL